MYLNRSVDIFAVFLPRLKKLHISQNIRYLRITNIESNMYDQSVTVACNLFFNVFNKKINVFISYIACYSRVFFLCNGKYGLITISEKNRHERRKSSHKTPVLVQRYFFSFVFVLFSLRSA